MIELPKQFSMNWFGDTGSGKTAQVGPLAELVHTQRKQKTCYYAIDRGGHETIRPWVNVGLIDVMPYSGDPFAYLKHAALGKVFNKVGKNNLPEWEDPKEPYGAYIFDSGTSISDELMLQMAGYAGSGVDIGGGGAHNFKAAPKTSQEFVVGSNNMSHYSVAQQQIFERIGQSEQLPAVVVWTFNTKRGEEEDNSKVLGPQVAGRAITTSIPRWFTYTFRFASSPAAGGAKHTMYIEEHQDEINRMLQGFGNARVPLGAKVDTRPIQPTSIVTAMERIYGAHSGVEKDIAKRLGL